MVAFATALSLVSPAHAAGESVTAPQAGVTAEASTAPYAIKKGTSPAAHIESRIDSLHDRLKITKDQEQLWTPVAAAMRDNEKAIHVLISERHEHAKTLSAVEDLESYEKIADEHAEGLKKLIPSFKTLYEAMSDDQKKNADTVFGRYEGHPDRKADSGK